MPLVESRIASNNCMNIDKSNFSITLNAFLFFQFGAFYVFYYKYLFKVMFLLGD